MATFSVMEDVPNPLFDLKGDPFSGAVLKAFLPGTTTSISIRLVVALKRLSLPMPRANGKYLETRYSLTLTKNINGASLLMPQMQLLILHSIWGHLIM